MAAVLFAVMISRRLAEPRQPRFMPLTVGQTDENECSVTAARTLRRTSLPHRCSPWRWRQHSIRHAGDNKGWKDEGGDMKRASGR